MPSSESCIVVGSGPAGIACAQALIAAGKHVTIIDSGLTLEADRRSSLVRLASLPLTAWPSSDLDIVKGGVTASASGIPLKLAYGSDYPYRKVPGSTSIHCEGSESMPSYARGGLSTVWGSAVLPYRQADIEDWPITVHDLEPGYRCVLEWMPFSARHDDLAALFPLYHPQREADSLPMSRQAQGLLGAFKKNNAELKTQGVFFGQSRLAVKAASSNGDPLCAQCGLCMYGCPNSLIYSSDYTLTALLANSRLTYQSGYTVQRLSENASTVVLHSIDQSGKPVEFRADRVFLGAGLLNTTTILLRSFEQYETEVAIRDSQYFLMPLLRLKGTPNVVREPLHTLAQLFVEVMDPAVSPYTVHLQTYTYNDLFREAVIGKLRFAKNLFPTEQFLGRLLLFQGYLHSKHSSPIHVKLTRQHGQDTLQLQSSPDPQTRRRVRQLSSKFTRLADKTGVLPLPPLLQMGKPGRGFHSGGTFPMSRSPKSLESDIWGRPHGFSRVHAIDATVLPSIPATTITFTVMANAYRIGAGFDRQPS